MSMKALVDRVVKFFGPAEEPEFDEFGMKRGETTKEFFNRLEQEALDEIGKAPRREKLENVFEIIIASDNHREERQLSELLHYHDEADYYIHCGDSNLYPTNKIMKKFITVKGNTDEKLQYNDHEFLTLPTGEKIWVTHGHLELVGFKMSSLISDARSMDDKKPDLIFYGHLHKVDARIEDEFLIVSPGSISDPRDSKIKTYAQLFVSPEAYKINIYDAETREIIKDFEFQR